MIDILETNQIVLELCAALIDLFATLFVPADNFHDENSLGCPPGSWWSTPDGRQIFFLCLPSTL
jgi:hypothetical protein